MILTFEFNLRPMPHQSVKFGRNGIKYKPKKVFIHDAAWPDFSIHLLKKINKFINIQLK